jgi:myosin-1
MTLSLADMQRQPMVGVEDLVMLTTMNDKAIVENLKKRFERDLIYTSIGSVLISVNPFKRIPQYGPDKIEFYQRHGKTSTTPHIFGLAEETYRTMILEEENQCVIISGESGAGKTEAAKQIMLYIAAVSGDSDQMKRVKEIILESNPLLEAFGNAKTVRNDNSSRFGKFFEIYFDRVGGPVGGRMSNFLLEKSRVTKQQKGERNFHVFYQLCCGAEGELRTRLKLRQPGEFNYLSQGKTLERPGVDDAKEWRETLQAMEKIGFTDQERDGIIDLLAAILHIGEIKFEAEGDHAKVADDASMEELKFVASLLKVDATALHKTFVTKELQMTGETVTVKYDLQQAMNTRDALAKMIYDKMFNFVVMAVNRAFGKKDYALMLGVLDIYGFEIFEKNGFEQFCINYVNEKLQQIFIELTLKVEQEEYVREKIAWEEIKFFNNKVVCDLIDGKNPPGLFSVMDDVCATMAKEKEHVADQKMGEKLAGVHGGHAHFRRNDQGFMVKHYAGDVFYNTAGFTARNKDLLSPDLVTVIQCSDNGFFGRLISDLDVEAPSGAGRGKKAKTAGFVIRQQAEDLVRTLRMCTPHYVRTIKSNDEKQANLIDDARVTHQCKYLGLMENIKVRRAGFAYRQYFDKFLKRFKYISPKCFPKPFRGADKEACREIMKCAADKVPTGRFQLGETKMFVRQPQDVYALEELREIGVGKVVARIQRAWRRYSNRREWVILKRNMDKIYVKGGKERRSASVFRPFLGGSLNAKLVKEIPPLIEFDPLSKAWTEHFSEIGKKYYYNVITKVTQWDKPVDMDPQRILYAYKVQRVFNHAQGQCRTEYMVISDRAVYFIEKRKQMVVTPAEKPTKQNPKPDPPPEPFEETVWLLNKKLDIRLLRQLSVSKQADTYAVLHVYDAPTPYREIYMTPAEAKGPQLCQWSNEPFGKADKKANCPACGLIMKPQYLTKGRPLPTLGHPTPVAVCANCERGEPLEACEDVVISTPLKTEMVAMMRRVYRQVMGSKMPVTIDNAVPYQLSGEPFQRTCVFQPAGDITKPKLFVAEKQLVIHCPPGISQADIARQQAERDAKAKAELEAHKKQLADDKLKEEAKEKEREEAHKKMVEERKKQKAAEAERAAVEAEESERLRREKQERAKAAIAARAK